MANSGGNNGSVKIITNAGGSTVEVTFPAEPGPPAQEEHTDRYEEVIDPWLRRFEHAMPPLKVDVLVDGTGKPDTVTAHA